MSDRHSYPILVVLLLIAIVFFTNAFHESYPDEFDNILGGRYILQGRLIYTGFFTHHGPIPYYLAALVELFSGQSFVRFRIFYTVFLLALSFFSYFYIKARVGAARSLWYLIFMVVVAFSATYFWGHMLLADSLSGFLLTPVFVLVFLKAYYKERLTTFDFVFISVFTFSALLSSLTYIYLIAGIYLFILLYNLAGNYSYKNIITRKNIKNSLILIVPYLLFLLYLVATLSLKDYLIQALSFNQEYYVYNYPRPEGSSTINPIRFAIVIAYNFYDAFSSLLIEIRTLNFQFPFRISLAVANAGLLIYLLFKRRFILALSFLFVLIYSNARSNPFTSQETDYQSAVYIMISLFVALFVIHRLYQDLNDEKLDYAKKIVFTGLFFLVSIYTFFNYAFLLRKYTEKTYKKFMGEQPLIYDRPQIAPIINSITTKEEYALIGPFEFEELFYMNAQIPTKYHILIPGIGKSPKIQQDLLSDLKEKKPKVIYFDKRFFILGRSPEMYGQFFLNYLDENYVTLQQYEKTGKKYKSRLPVSGRVDLETKLYIQKERAPEVIGSLIEKGYIVPKE